MEIVCRDKKINYANKTILMGIVNTTTDSFSGDGIIDTWEAIKHALDQIKYGSEIIDIGGESSRPGSLPITIQEEITRVIPIIEYLAKYTETIISVDTYKPEVAKAALEAGAHIINDITGLNNPEIAKLVAHYKAGIVIMHMQNTPADMQQNPNYTDVVKEIKEFFTTRIKFAQKYGITKEQIILDPGIGFGKTLEHNLTIIKHLEDLRVDNLPILLGTSLKSFIGKITDKVEASERMWGTAGSVSTGIILGANIIRIHNVNELNDVIKVTDAIKYSI